jgi:transcriptional regulator with XRE-family HTH domain
VQDDTTFRRFVLGWLERRGWNQGRLAEASEISQSLLSKWLATDERKRVRPGPANLKRLAPILSVSYEDLLRMVGYLDGPSGVVSAAELDEIETDVNARVQQYIAAVRTTPRQFWRAIIDATFDHGEDWAHRLAEPASKANRVPPIAPDRDSQKGSIRSSRRPGRQIDSSYPAAALAH